MQNDKLMSEAVQPLQVALSCPTTAPALWLEAVPLPSYNLHNSG